MSSAYNRFLHVENVVHHQLIRHSITALRISVGAIFLGFGILKYFPGVSPAQNLAEATTHILFVGLIPGSVAIKLVATLECFIGVCLLANRWMRLAIWLLAIEFVGVLAPIFLLPARLFAGPHHAPTLEGQYVLKDVILVTAGLVIAAATFRGGRLVRSHLPPAMRSRDATELGPDEKLRVVLDGIGDGALVSGLCEHHQISEATFYEWRDAALAAATDALARDAPDAVAAGGADRRELAASLRRR